MAHSLQQIIAQELEIALKQVSASLSLLAEGATIPFIARYRKEVTGSLDEVQLTTIRDRAEQLEQLEQRRKSIVNSLAERNLLTTKLHNSLITANTLAKLEDIYLPYKPKRRTRATIAREQGLELLAKQLMELKMQVVPETEARRYISETKGVPDAKTALQGARDIIAEQINENKEAREEIRELFLRRGVLFAKVIKGKELEGNKYSDYFAWQELIGTIPSHRLLAILRAEKEGILSVSIRPEEEVALYRLEQRFIKGASPSAEQVKLALRDSYKRLLAPSMETEARKISKEKADLEAIRVFADNLRQLLLEPPLGERRVLAIDPGFRTGCKLVCLDEQGKLLEHSTIFPHPPQKQKVGARAAIEKLVKQHNIEVIAIGNGTASRETERFVKSLELSIEIVVVNESGASIYSASEVARAEFPNHDVTVRGAISIGRRLTDPLAELVKIEPKSIGVGQYQHDVDQNKLKQSLDDTVISCVNAVGVDINTASKELLTYVSGLGPALAQNIVDYRNQQGPFKMRKQFMEVSRLGTKAFEQAAGFLRIRDGEHPLDASSVHPESYSVVEKMAIDLDVKIAELMQDENLRKRISLEAYTTSTVGIPTLTDIMQELEKPGRDPRETFERFDFSEAVNSLEDLHEGMILPGIITNITNFGAFVDVGVHQDGLIHVSQLADNYIKHPSEVVSVHQKVQVQVLSVDSERKRIGLSMRKKQ